LLEPRSQEMSRMLPRDGAHAAMAASVRGGAAAAAAAAKHRR
jgi:hypothetical protein